MDEVTVGRVGPLPLIVTSVGLLVLWQVMAVIVGEDTILVTPWRVVTTLVQLAVQPSFWTVIAHSFGKIVTGFLLAFSLGLAAAWGSSCNRWLRALFDTSMRLMRSIPLVSIILLLVIWATPTYLSLLVSFLIAIPIVYSNAWEGFAARDPELAEIAQVFAFSAPQRWWAVTLPALVPYLVAATRAGFGLAWKAGVSAEVIGTPGGSIGERLTEAKDLLSTADLFAWTVVVVTLSYACEKLALWALGRLQVRLRD
jgi:NitT/TauT family transport system permease protein